MNRCCWWWLQCSQWRITIISISISISISINIIKFVIINRTHHWRRRKIPSLCEWWKYKVMFHHSQHSTTAQDEATVWVFSKKLLPISLERNLIFSLQDRIIIFKPIPWKIYYVRVIILANNIDPNDLCWHEEQYKAISNHFTDTEFIRINIYTIRKIAFS